MPKKKRKLRAFISYAKADKKKAFELSSRLKDDGVDVWIDEEKLDPGLEWDTEIEKAIINSDVVIFCLTNKFNSVAGYRHKEVGFALDAASRQPEGEIFIIPAKIENCHVPQKIKKWQFVKLFEKDGHESLLRSLRKRAANIGGIHDLRQRSLDSMALDIMNKNLLVFNEDDSVEDVRKAMKEKNSTCVLIPPTGGNAWYIFTKTDLLIALSTGKDLTNLSVKDFSSEVNFSVHPNLSVTAVIKKMVRNGVSHLPVYDSKRNLVGVINGNDLIYL